MCVFYLEECKETDIIGGHKALVFLKAKNKFKYKYNNISVHPLFYNCNQNIFSRSCSNLRLCIRILIYYVLV